MEKKSGKTGDSKRLRQRAVELLSRNTKDIASLPKREIAELVQELGIYQVELEMQNEELQKAQVELENSRHRYSDLYDFAPVGYFVLDKNGVILDVNLSGTTFLGVEKSRMIGKPLSIYINREDQDKYFLFRRKVLETYARQSCEIQFKTGTGEVLYALLFAEAVKDTPTGDIQCRMAVTNITERKQAEEILKRDKKTLQKMVEERSAELIKIQAEMERSKRLSDIGTLAATVAHELRNPLAGIGLATAVIKKKTADNIIKRQLKGIDNMVAESGQIIDNLLFYSRLRPKHRKTFALHPLLEECIDTLRHAHIGKNIVISKYIDSLKDVQICADPVQIREVFTNILNNAADAVSDHGGEIDVEARVYRELIKIHMTNNGRSISMRNLKKVFDPFFTTKAKGTGLGLTVSMQIVKMHGGSINIKDRNGKGTSFIITLPKRETKVEIKSAVHI
jgi:PAS domain S-box-containing protein